MNPETLTQLLDFLRTLIAPEDLASVQRIVSPDGEDDDPEPIAKPPGTAGNPLTRNGTPAMDASTASFIQALRLAETETKPIIGDVPPQRLPSDYYKLAFAARGIAMDGVPSSALPAAFQAAFRALRSGGGSRPGMAMDAKAAKAFAERFPGASSLKIR